LGAAARRLIFMIDINFYRKFDGLRMKLEAGEKMEKNDLFLALEELRDKNPIVYNIETTNACNMRCQMCPRTTMMTRKIGTISKELFIKIVDQLKPHSESDWKEWEKFTEAKYGVSSDGMSENHFFLYVIPKVIQLHGYGDPLLDPNIGQVVKILRDRGFYSYFSCNPANISIEKTAEMFENGLDYIKYSIESVDDARHKEVRGQASNFSESYKKILELLDMKAKRGYKTAIVITMIDIHQKDQAEQYEKLKEAFHGLDVYIYFKSEDQQWYRKDYHGTKSIHWSEVCRHPWMSTTIKSNGEVAMCMEDFNNEIIFGDAAKESLYDIWNGKKYAKFRRDHFELAPGIKCTGQCDMKVIGKYLK